MKYSKLFFSILLVIGLILNHASAQYSIVPTGTSSDIDEIEKVGNIIVINGNYQYLSRCVDNCDNLVTILPMGTIQGTNRGLIAWDSSNFYFANYALTFPNQYYKIYRSKNGGQNWTEIFNSTTIETTNILVFDTTNVVLVSTYDDKTYHTTNAGLNWIQGANHPVAPSSVSKSLRINDSVAIIGGDSQLGLTMNKGMNWISSNYIDAIPNNFDANTQDSIYFVANASGQAGYLSYFFNGILSNRVDRFVPGTLPIGIYVVSQHEIYVTGKDYTSNKGRILKTTDLGLTWTHFDIQENKYLADLVPLNDSIFLIGGQGGLLIKWNKNAPMQPITLGIDEVKNVLDVQIFPNPSGTIQQIEINNPLFESVEVSVLDALGRDLGLFFITQQPTTDEKITIDISNLSTGTFFYRIKIGNQIIHKPFQKL